MPRFSANISMLFTERPFLERFAAAKAAGFAGVEFQFPYDTDAGAIADAAGAAEIPVVLFNHMVGDLPGGGKGIAAHPGKEEEFKAALELTHAYAEAIRPANVNLLAGWPPVDEVGRARCLEILAGNLALAAAALKGLGVRVLTEAVNTVDRPGFLLDRTVDALAAIEAAGHPNLAIQYDIYHMHIMEGRVAETIAAEYARIGHIQFADAPGRHEPGTGEIDFESAFRAIDGAGWQGFVGAEYVPSKATGDTLGWLGSYA